MKKYFFLIVSATVVMTCNLSAEAFNEENIVYENGNTITVKQEYSTENANGDFNFEDEIVYNGYTYKLDTDNIKKSLLDTESNVLKTEKKQIEVTTTELPSKEYDFDETVETKYNNIPYTANFVREYYTTASINTLTYTAEAQETFYNQVTKPQPVPSKGFEIQNQLTGEMEIHVLDFDRLESTSTTWTDPEEYDFTFTTYSADYYEFNGVRLKHDDKECPLNDNLDVVYSLLGLDKSKYKVVKAEWNGKADTKKDTRKAVVYIRKLAATYVAHYSAEIEFKGDETYIGHGIYEYEIPYEIQTLYLFSAQLNYVKETPTMTTTTTTTTSKLPANITTTTSKVTEATRLTTTSTAKKKNISVAAKAAATTGGSIFAAIVIVFVVKFNAVAVYDMEGRRLFSCRFKHNIDLTKVVAMKKEKVRVVFKNSCAKKMEHIGGIMFMANGRQLVIESQEKNEVVVKMEYMELPE